MYDEYLHSDLSQTNYYKWYLLYLLCCFIYSMFTAWIRSRFALLDLLLLLRYRIQRRQCSTASHDCTLSTVGGKSAVFPSGYNECYRRHAFERRLPSYCNDLPRSIIRRYRTVPFYRKTNAKLLLRVNLLSHQKNFHVNCVKRTVITVQYYNY